ncbi:MAG: quinoprotein glucose dehydrogenase [Bryobacterales bacterium]|nr:quinoprotein glucose dehydrogenase [Bryobacterales bacterium]
MRILCVAMLAATAAMPVRAQTDWPVYGHDPGGMKFSPLTQINTTNIAKLERAWTYHTGEKGRQFESTPLVVGGVMYVSTQQQRIVALEPETGKEIWKYDPKARAREHRGVSYWAGDRQTPPRIVFGTGDGRLIALDARTGNPAVDFGDNGVVDLRVGVADKYPKAGYAITSPPAIYRNLVIVGPNTQEGPSHGPSGDPRAFDVRTGKLVWRFHTVPQPGEPGNETWGPDGWKERSGPSLWGVMTVDTERGLVFLPTGNPADSFYGGDRKGTNLYANCVVALDAATGKLRWYYQIVHHDIFDYDVTGAPALIDVVQNGKRIPAVAEITKMGLLFILNRLDGKPVFGAEERPVAKSDVPGEEAWPTQPFPLKPPPLARMSLKRDEIARRTPESERYCRELFDQLHEGGPYTPYGMAKATLLFPGAMGGGNWGGVSFDPKLGYVFVNTSNMGAMGHIVPVPAGSPMPYRNESGYARFLDQDQYPCQQPPWGELSAVNANTGDIAWKVPLGSFEELEAQGFKNAGTPNVGGTIATAGGLVFVAATNDSKFRAFDSRTGKELWTGRLDATGNSTPITYQGRHGKQYVAITAGGPDHLRNVGDNSKNNADSLIVFALPGGNVTTPNLTSKNVSPPSAKKAASTAVAAITNGRLPEGEGRDVVVRMCTRCHGAGTFANSRMNRNEWQDEVDDMIARGAVGTNDEVRTVVDYLAANLGGSSGSQKQPRRK